jgi:RNA recognition motif-containing protein
MAKLYVGNLSFDTTDDSLQQLFSSNGYKVDSVRVIRDMNSGRSRGFGFVEMASAEEAAKAIAQLNGFSMDGRALQVNEARPQAPRGHSGGGGGGGGRDGGRGGRGGGGGGRGRY